MTCRKYLAFIRSLPCAVCGTRRHIEAAHTGTRGLGQKSSDLSAIPLCAHDHRHSNSSYHRLGPQRFAEKWGIDTGALVARLNAIGLGQIELLHGFGRLERGREYARYHCSCGWRTAWYRMDADARGALHQHMGEKEAAAA